jgi:hypothetical protein
MRLPSQPWFQQVTDYCCGEASMAMVFSYWTPAAPVSQLWAIDVARSSPEVGTLTLDIVRAGRFSALSAAPCAIVPNPPQSGYPGRPLGLAAGWRADDQPWLDDLRAVLAQGVPVIALMNYADNDLEGHYRVVTGYNSTAGLFYTLDPWGRGEQPPTMVYSEADFVYLWNLTEGAPGAPAPFFGAFLAPWSVDLSAEPLGNGSFALRAVATNPCFSGFVCQDASSVVATLDVDARLVAVSSDAGVPIGDAGVVPAGASAGATWIVTPRKWAAGRTINATVTVRALVSDNVPEVYCCDAVVYIPGYAYVDAVGGAASTLITFSSD